MKRINMKALFVMVVGLLMLSTAAFAQRGRARTMVDRLVEEARSGQRVNRARLETTHRRFESQVERLLRRKSGLSSRDINIDVIRDYVAKIKDSPQNLEAFTETLQAVTARGNVVPAQQQATAGLLARLIKLHGRNGFAIESRDVLEMHRNWRQGEIDMLSDVLLEARTIQDGNPRLSSAQAFERALENRGLLEKYKRRCV